MVLDYLKKKAAQDRDLNHIEKPSWTSDKNASLNAWRYVETTKIEKLQYISSHKRPTHFTNKGSYQINAAEVARAVKINRSTLMHQSSYSEDFKRHLSEVNVELELAKDRQLSFTKKRPSRGPIGSNKDELVKVNAELRVRIAQLEIQKTEELVRLAFDRLPLPVKRTLGLD